MSVVSTKSEAPTPKRLQKARESGDSGASHVLSQAVGFGVAAIALPSATRAAVQTIQHWMIDVLRSRDAHFDVRMLALSILSILLPLLLIVAVASSVVQLIQTRGIVSAKRLALDSTRLLPRVSNLISLGRVVAVGRALIAAVVVGAVVVYLARAHVRDLAMTVGRTSAAAMVAGTLTEKLIYYAAVLGIALGFLDAFVVHKMWMFRLRMSKDEVRREHREAEGDPEHKAARERAHHEVLFSVQLANVKSAHIVVVNPTHIACALRYREGDDDAPVLVAAGMGANALQIIDAARAYGVPILRDVPLARSLYELAIDEGIPEILYETVAEVLRAVWEEHDSAGT